MYQTQHISVSIARPPDEVYRAAREFSNWASGLTPEMRIKLTDRNIFGVLDHDVTLPSGEEFYNPLRVLRNGDGAEVVFTLFRMPGVSDQDFERDAATISRDLRALKALLEK